MIRVRKDNKFVDLSVSLPSSKSITNRALIIQALCNERIDIENSSEAEDSKILKSVLNNLPSIIDVKDAGTTFRFLTAFLSIQPGTFILTGSERMKQRPIGVLVNALREIGADIEFLERNNFPPLKIIGKRLHGGKLSIDAAESSQFISALLLIAPKLTLGLKLELTGKINSIPYIEMTLSLMKYFGININWNSNFIEIPFQDYSPEVLKVENDWSSASFWYEIAALSEESEIVLKKLNKKSIQGDVVIDDIMKKFGVQTFESGEDIVIRKFVNQELPSFFDYDFSSCPDLVLPVAAVCAVLKIPSMFRGVKNLRIKESDRLNALKNELIKIGGKLIVEENFFSIEPIEYLSDNKIFHAYNDHRMVMSFAPLALKLNEVIIDDHLPVNKSYPDFWNNLRNAGFTCEIT